MQDLLKRQLAKATENGEVDYECLLELVESAYVKFEQQHLRAARANRLLLEELALSKSAEEAIQAQRVRNEAESSRLRERKRMAEAESKAKSSFLAVMSHEIRTPMNAVIGLSSVLLESHLPAEQKKLIAIIHNAGEGLRNILNDVLDHSKLVAGQRSFEEIDFSFEDLLSSATSIIQPQAIDKGIKVVVYIDPKLPDAHLGDPGRLRQVVLNLLSNAVKFTEVGTVGVDLTCVQNMPERTSIECRIWDTGIGIPQDSVSRLFNDFVQDDSSINRRFGGSGLGLSISKSIIEAMGGRIQIKSKPRVGTEVTFRLTLPVGQLVKQFKDETRVNVEPLQCAISRMATPFHLLIVDDNATNRLVVEKMMESLPIHIDHASSGQAAVAAANLRPYNAILMDMRMPDMDGPSASRIIRGGAGLNKHTPIIAFTANSLSADLEACRQSGMNVSVTKPIRKQELLDALLVALENKRMDAVALAEQSLRPPLQQDANPCEPTAIVFNAATLALLIEAIGDEGCADAMTSFTLEARQSLGRLGSFAVDTDTIRIRFEAHLIRGNAATFGFTLLAELAGRLETGAHPLRQGQYADIVKEMEFAFEQARAAADRVPRKARISDWVNPSVGDRDINSCRRALQR